MTTRVLVLGAGFGGLELAARLTDALDDVEVTLLDQRDSFVFGSSKLDVVFGRESADAVRHRYADLARPRVEFRQERVTAIDPRARRVTTDRGVHEADVLVVALGADLDPAATPGLAEGGGVDFYSVDGAQRAAEALAAFDGGRVVIGVLGPGLKCPPAPSETALLLHEHLVQRSLRERSSITLVTPMPSPVPVSPETSAALLAAFAERAIEFRPDAAVAGLDPATKVATLGDGTALAYDLFLAVPRHVAPPVVVEAGLTGDDGWVTIDPATFATPFPDVYAVGDVTSAPVPRAGVFAEGEARTVADVLLARLGDGAEPPPYTGAASCFLSFGDAGVARVDVEFLGTGPPIGRFAPPSAEHAREKERFGPERRERWFGTTP